MIILLHDCIKAKKSANKQCIKVSNHENYK